MARLRINPSYSYSYPSAVKWSLSLKVGADWILYADLRAISLFSDGFAAGTYDSYIVLWDASNTMLYSFSGFIYFAQEIDYQWDVALNELEPVPGTPPNCPVPYAPTGEVSGAGITFSWSNVAAATMGYELEIYKGGVLWTPVIVTFSSSILVDVTLVGKSFPQDGSQFSWHVRARNEAGYSAWSDTLYGWTYFISALLATVPSPPTLLSPANGANVPGPSITFTWNPSAGADKYYLHVYDTI